MRKLFPSKKAKRVIDILLFIGILGLIGTGKTWSSPHCIGASIWLLLMLIHIAQHWKHTKFFTSWSVIRRNKITAFTILGFILMLLSMLLFIFELKDSFIAFHHVAGRLFLLIIIIHVINKFKRFKSLFSRDKRTTSKIRSEV
jgi:membrane-bound ClpP family serine protease